MSKLVTVLFVGLIISVLFLLRQPTQTDTPRTATEQMEQFKSEVQPVDRLSGVERQTFMHYCNVSGDIERYCQCTLDYLEENNSAARIRQMDEEVSGDYLPPEMWNAVYACMHHVEDYQFN